MTVVEGRGPDFVFWKDKLKEYSDEVHVVTGCGKTAWANDFIEQELQSGKKIDRIFAHGCPFMMKVSSEASRAAGVETIVSLTPIMVDGTGMCGACRVEVDGKTKFACVDGPDFAAMPSTGTGWFCGCASSFLKRINPSISGREITGIN